VFRCLPLESQTEGGTERALLDQREINKSCVSFPLSQRGVIIRDIMFVLGKLSFHALWTPKISFSVLKYFVGMRMTMTEEPLTVKFYPHNHIHTAEERGLAHMNKAVLTSWNY
jgi:hypothetical protein